MRKVIIFITIGLFSFGINAQVDLVSFYKNPQSKRIFIKKGDQIKRVLIKSKWGDILVYNAKGHYFGKYMPKNGKLIFIPNKLNPRKNEKVNIDSTTASTF